MLKSVDLNPDDNYEESNSDFIHQILGLGTDICCYENHFQSIKRAERIVEVIQKIAKLMDEIYDINIVSNEIEPLSDDSKDSKIDLEVIKTKFGKQGDYDQTWVESNENRAKLKKDKKFPFYYEGTLIDEFLDRSCLFDSWADESLEKFNSIDLSNKLRKISNLLESTEDLFEEFLDFHEISIYDHPYWKNRYPSFEDLDEKDHF